MIPQVRTWKVTYYFKDDDPRQVFVDTINKRFANWMSHELVTRWWEAEKVTITLAGVQKA